MIQAIVGLPGSGKTLWATKLLLDAKRKQTRALANFHSTQDAWEFALWDDIREAGNCYAVIDEAHMWFSARNWTKTDQIELSYFQQHRKEGVNLDWIAQHEARVDVAIREVTAFIWRVRKVGQFLLLRQCTLEDKKPLKTRFWKVDKSIFRHYYTNERIGQKDGTGYRLGALGGAVGTGGRSAGKPTPSHYRIEWPDGSSTLLPASDALLARKIGNAAAGWAIYGVPKSAGSIVVPVVRDSSGRFIEVGVIAQHEPSILAEAERMMHAFLRIAKGGVTIGR